MTCRFRSFLRWLFGERYPLAGMLCEMVREEFGLRCFPSDARSFGTLGEAVGEGRREDRLFCVAASEEVAVAAARGYPREQRRAVRVGRRAAF